MQDHHPIVWNNELETGIDEIDDQHRILVKALNDAGVRLSGKHDASLLERITRDLLSYAIYHFEIEENLMAQYNYALAHADDAQAHNQQHRSFSAQVVELRDGLRTGIPVSRENLLSFLNNWLVGHIKHTDKKLAAFIQTQRG